MSASTTTKHSRTFSDIASRSANSSRRGPRARSLSDSIKQIDEEIAVIEAGLETLKNAGSN